MRRAGTVFALAALLGLAAAPAGAGILTTCAAPAGRTISVDGPTGWTEEKRPDATLVFTTDAVSGFDVTTRSPAGESSARAAGARIRRAFGSEDGPLTLVAEFPLGTVDTYQLALDTTGSGTLIMASLTNGVVGVTRGSLLRAACTRPPQ